MIIYYDTKDYPLLLVWTQPVAATSYKMYKFVEEVPS